MKPVRDIGLLFQRYVIQLLRNPVWLIVGFSTPILYLVLFMPLLKHAVGSVGLSTQFTPGRPGGHIGPAAVERMLEQYGSDEFDVIAIGRALLADATWVNRLREGSLDGFNGYDTETALTALN